VSDLQQPSYPNRPIYGVGALSKTLHVSKEELIAVSACCDGLYRLAKPIVKPDGSIRQPFDALPRLKRIHVALQDRVLRHVRFPDYITGSTKGKDARANAMIHAGSKIAICEDIKSFFPSARRRVVFDIWRHFFRFDDDAADLLTRLCLKQDALPQGAIPSSYLANLAFWRWEPRLHARFAGEGIAYSRYVDDVTVSSKRVLSRSDMTECIRRIYGMMHAGGFKPKRSKHEVFSSGRRMLATKLVINTKPSLTLETRSAVRTAVHELERQAVLGWSLELEKSLNRAAGRAGRVKSMHPAEGRALLLRIREVRDGLRTKSP
jgi:hypothetical protein